jgi:hypothetical protein
MVNKPIDCTITLLFAGLQLGYLVESNQRVIEDSSLETA